MCKSLTRLTPFACCRRRRARGPADTYSEPASELGSGTAAAMGLREVIRDRGELTSPAALHVAPRFDAHRRPLPFAERSDAAANEEHLPAYAYVLAVLTGDRERLEASAREQLRVGAVRSFVTLELHRACVMDCRSLPQIDEARLRAHDAASIAIVRACRDAGADLLLIRGTLSERIAVLFTAAVGDRIRVLGEEAAVLRADGRWARVALDRAVWRRWRRPRGLLRWIAARLRRRRMAGAFAR